MEKTTAKKPRYKRAGGKITGTKPRPLALQAFLPYRLSVLANTVSSAFARLYGDRFDLTIPEWRVMAVLGSQTLLSAGEVAERTAMDKVRVSRAVARLVRKGRVLRATDPADRRRAVLRLSAKGTAVYRRIVPLARKIESDLIAALSPTERRALDRLLAKLQARAETL